MIRWHAALLGVLLLLLAFLPAPAAEPTEQVVSALVGPIVNPGQFPRIDAAGVEAAGYRAVLPLPKPDPWVGQWIWTGGTVVDRAWFRTEIELNQAPKSAAVWITADKKYRLWVNGRLVSRGPADHGRDMDPRGSGIWFYDARELASAFRAGTNVIAVEVMTKGPWGAVVSRGSGLRFEARIDQVVLGSDATWRATPARAVHGWQLPGYATTDWAPARLIPDIWQPLIVSEIPPLMEARYPALRYEGLTQNRTFTADGGFKVVFDRALSGFPQIRVRGGAGTIVRIKAMRLVEFKLHGGEEALEVPFLDAIEPAYVVELKQVQSPLEILDAGAVFTSQPVAYRGSFSCSDPRLEENWKASRWATQICMQTHHLDSPLRQESLADPGDYCIQALVAQYAFGQPLLARQDIRKFAWILKNQGFKPFHTSYTHAWLQMLLDYYDHTGDATLVTEMAPYVHGLIDTIAGWQGANGIISEAPNYMFMDWVTIGGFPCHHPPAVIGQGYMTAFFYHDLEMGIRVASVTGDTARSERYRTLRSNLAKSFTQELWNPDKGLFRDGKPFQTSVKPSRWLPEDKAIETFSPHVNLLAILYGLAPQDQWSGIAEKVLAGSPLNVQPWFYHWVFPALDQAGQFDRVARQHLLRWKVLPDTQTFRERWDAGTASHGWCSTPLVQMSARILGVTPAAPGFSRIAIRPQTCGLTWAKGSVPTPHGDVQVSWTTATDSFALETTIPPHTTAEVVLPFVGASASVVTCDGKPATLPLRLDPGPHIVRASRPTSR